MTCQVSMKVGGIRTVTMLIRPWVYIRRFGEKKRDTNKETKRGKKDGRCGNRTHDPSQSKKTMIEVVLERAS